MRPLFRNVLATSIAVVSMGCGNSYSTGAGSGDGSGDEANDGTGGVLGGSGGMSAGGAPPATGGATSGGTGNTTGGATASGGSLEEGTGGDSGIELPALTKGDCTLGAGVHLAMGRTEEQYLGVDVTREGKNYRMITNGWGQNWQSHDISWLGTTLHIHDYQGARQANGAPAGYPSVFCGDYSDTSASCGLPRQLDQVNQLNTAAAWTHTDGNGTYNVAYDVWLGNSAGGFGGLQSYFMVWLHDPAVEGPAGAPVAGAQQIAVTGAPGLWNIIAGTVNGLPIVNYVRAEGDDVHAIAIDIMDFIRDAQTRELNFPGDTLLAVAIGFEIWQGPVTNLTLEDFCLDIQ